jgi:hypothetical protein
VANVNVKQQHFLNKIPQILTRWKKKAAFLTQIHDLHLKKRNNIKNNKGLKTTDSYRGADHQGSHGVYSIVTRLTSSLCCADWGQHVTAGALLP